MTLPRALIALSQVVLNHWATQPPHKAPVKGRYKTKGNVVFGLAPLVFWLQRPLLCMDTMLELLTILHTSYLTAGPTSPTPFCPAATAASVPADLYVTPLALLGIALVLFGTSIRLACYKALGTLFTFDLCIKPEHRLVTEFPYNIVRHPAYLGSLCLTAGLTFTGLTSGSWIRECGVPRGPVGEWSLLLVGLLWWTFTAGVGWTRSVAEDAQMRKMFPEEWEKYAEKVRYWFVPGLI